MTSIVLDEYFPYHDKETFLETEVRYQHDAMFFAFSATRDMPARKMPPTAKAYAKAPGPRWLGAIRKAYYYAMSLFQKDFYAELRFLKKQKILNAVTVKRALSFMSVSLCNYMWAKGTLRRVGVSPKSRVMLYAYWMSAHAYTAVLLKRHYFKNARAISRGHRFDIYEYMYPYSYIPLRQPILADLDHIYSISEDGARFIGRWHPDAKDKISVARLGTRDRGYVGDIGERRPLKIVSCSWLVPVKRVDRIITAIRKVQDVPIEWTHFGGGKLLTVLGVLASTVLKPRANITYELAGSVPNHTILDKYLAEQYHVFVNVSENEGIPVSMMEALSFGTPVIATDVGGVDELVSDGENGFLLPGNFRDDDLAALIGRMAHMPEEEYAAMRRQARRRWEDKYDAEKNYTRFAEEISLLGGQG